MEFSQEDILKLERVFNCAIKEAHEKVVKEMYPLFGLQKAPPLIETKDGLGAILGKDPETNQWFITVKGWGYLGRDAFMHSKATGANSLNEWLTTRAFDSAHETGHYLHYVANPIEAAISNWKDFRKPKLAENPHYLSETIAELTAIEYSTRMNHTGSAFFLASTYPYFHPAWAMHREHGPELITKLVTSRVPKALEIIKPYHHLLESPAIPPEELCGMFIHEEAA